MPIEIREVVIKAQLERSVHNPMAQQQNLNEERILELKEEILSELLEKLEEKLWPKLKM